MFRGLILKLQSKKLSKKENKRKARREEENFSTISKLPSVYGETPVQEANVDALTS